MSKINNLTTENFESEVAEGVSFVAFWAPWCGPCRMMAPVYEKVAQELEDVKVCKVNTDEHSDIATKFNVRSIPMMLFIKNGKLQDTLLGAQSKDTIIAKLNSLK